MNATRQCQGLAGLGIDASAVAVVFLGVGSVRVWLKMQTIQLGFGVWDLTLLLLLFQVLGEIRPYLVGTGGGELHLDSIDGPIVKVKITGPAANVMTVRVAVTQKLREKIPGIAAVQLL